MRSKTWRNARAAAALLALSAAGGAALADVKLEERTTVEGPAGTTAGEGTATITIAGDRARQETKGQAAGALQRRRPPQGRHTASITRLDRSALYEIDYLDGSYYEIPFDQMKANRDAVLEAMAEAGTGGGEEGGRQRRLSCEKPRLESRPAGESRQLNGFTCRGTVVTGTARCENVQTKQTCQMTYTAEAWTTPVTGALEEAQGFYRRQAEALGVDLRERNVLGGPARAMLWGSGEGFQALVETLRSVEGFPIRTTFAAEVEGECGLSAPAAPSEAAAGAPAGRLREMMQRRKAKGGAGATGETGSEAGPRKLFTITREVTSVSTEKAPADAFEPPAGFTKKEPPAPGPAR